MGWNSSRIKHVARLSYGLGQPPPLSSSGIPIIRATNIYRGKINADGLIFADKSNIPLDRAPLLQSGEILVVRSGAYTGDSALVTDRWSGSAPGYDLRLTPTGADARFLAYCLLGSAVLQQIDIARSRAAQPHLNAEELGDVSINLPSRDEQRRIADFLDAETVQIDEMRSMREAQASLLEEHEQSSLDRTFRNTKSGRPTRLKHLLSMRPRYGVLVPTFADDGIPFIRVNDLQNISQQGHPLRRIPASLSAQYSRTIVRPGDLLVSVVGTLGRSAIASKSLAGANIARAICSLRVAPDVEVELVRAWLGTSAFRDQARLATSTDTAQPTLGMEDFANFKLIWPAEPSERQHILAEVRDLQRWLSALKSRLTLQRETLAERRRGLITAAVTGQIDVSTASGRGVTDGLHA